MEAIIIGEIASCFLEYTIALKCFVNDKDVLLFGNWYHKDFSGELCIHASIQNLIINHGKKTPSGLTPAFEDTFNLNRIKTGS